MMSSRVARPISGEFITACLAAGAFVVLGVSDLFTVAALWAGALSFVVAVGWMWRAWRLAKERESHR
jgi:hypothetical protein